MILALTNNNNQTNFLVAWLARGPFVCPDGHFHQDALNNCDSTGHLAESLKYKRTRSLNFSFWRLHASLLLLTISKNTQTTKNNKKQQKTTENNIPHMLNLTNILLLAFVPPSQGPFGPLPQQ
jgi:hypothetical protein